MNSNKSNKTATETKTPPTLRTIPSDNLGGHRKLYYKRDGKYTLNDPSTIVTLVDATPGYRQLIVRHANGKTETVKFSNIGAPVAPDGRVLSVNDWPRIRRKEILQVETPAEPSTVAEFPEGKAVERRHKARERNSALIKQAKAIFRQKHNGQLFCEICTFNFHSRYGELGRGYIESHHLIPISELTGTTNTRVEDIALVCSNCHRMLHRRRPWLGRSELKKLMKK